MLKAEAYNVSFTSRPNFVRYVQYLKTLSFDDWRIVMSWLNKIVYMRPPLSVFVPKCERTYTIIWAGERPTYNICILAIQRSVALNTSYELGKIGCVSKIQWKTQTDKFPSTLTRIAKPMKKQTLGLWISKGNHQIISSLAPSLLSWPVNLDKDTSEIFWKVSLSILF